MSPTIDRQPLVRTLAPAIVLAVLQGAWTETALAQPLSASTVSIEWRAATAEQIVRGVVENVSVHEPRGPIHRYQTVTVRVLETLKGERSERVRFVQDGDFGGLDLARLQKEKQELLLFLGDWRRDARFGRSTGGYAYARFPLLVESVAALTPEKVRFSETGLPPRTANLTPLTTPETLIGAVRSYLAGRRGDEPLEAVTIELPPSMREGYVAVHFTFPADARPKGDGAVKVEPIDFAEFKKRFAKNEAPPKKPPYKRSKSGYVGISAIELMAADCDTIVRGTLEDSCFVAATDDPTGPECGARLRVVETLKGEPAKHLNFVVTDARDLEQFRRDGQELVVFLRRTSLSPKAKTLGHQTRAELWDDSVIVLDRREAEALFADMTWHREPGEILARLREITTPPADEAKPGAARVPRRAPPIFDFHPPASLVAGSSIEGNDHSILYLPVDDRLEANARSWIGSKNKDLRGLGATALLYFKSDKNAALLLPLLSDDAVWTRREMLFLIKPQDPNHDPEHLVRWEAWNVLHGWGVDVDPPRFRRP